MPHVVNFNGLYSLPEEILSLDNDKIFDYINNFSIYLIYDFYLNNTVKKIKSHMCQV